MAKNGVDQENEKFKEEIQRLNVEGKRKDDIIKKLSTESNDKYKKIKGLEVELKKVGKEKEE